MDEVYSGKVTYYNNNEGFGYAETSVNNTTTIVFLHFSRMESLEFNKNIKVGDIVSFNIYPNLRDGYSAENIK